MYADVTKTYLQSSSIRGFPRIIKAQNPFSKILWILVVLVFTGIAVWQVSEVVKGYLRYEVQLEYRSHSDPTAPFPSVTVCNQQPFAADGRSDSFYEYVTRVNGLQSSLRNVSLSFLRNIAAFYQNSRVMQIDAIAHRKFSFIKDCVFELMIDNNIYLEGCSERNFQKFPHPRYFRCYTINYNGPPNVHLRSVRLVMYLDNFNYPLFSRDLLDNDLDAVRQGVRVSAHPSGSLPQLDTNFIDVPPGMSATLQVSTVHRRQLSKPYGSCQPERHKRLLASSPLEDSLSYAYTQHACHRMCQHEMLISRCNCVDPTLPLPPGIGIDDGNSSIDYVAAAPLVRSKRSDTGGAAAGLVKAAAPAAPAAAASPADSESAPAMVRPVPYCRRWPRNVKDSAEAASILLDQVKCAEGIRGQSSSIKSCLVNSRNLTCYQPCNFTEHSVSTSYAGWPQESFHLAVYEKYIAGTNSSKFFAEYERIKKLLAENRMAEVYAALHATNLMRENFVEIQVMKPSWNVTEIAQVPSFPLFRLLSAIGGTMNLWSGITIIAIVEFLELSVILVGTFVKNRIPADCTSPQTKQQQEESLDAEDDASAASAKKLDGYGSLFQASKK